MTRRPRHAPFTRGMTGLFAAVAVLALSPATLPEAAARQVADTSAAGRFMARADSLRASRESAPDTSQAVEAPTRAMPAEAAVPRPRPLYRLDLPGRRAGDDLSDQLHWPGAFLHDFGTDGWPDAWSPEGIDPARIGLRFAGIPFDDPFTGAPAWDLLPVALIDHAELHTGPAGRVLGVEAEPRAFMEPQPVTEARYRSGGSLQGVEVVHAQHRTIMGGRHPLSVVAGYTGAGAQGEYEGSRMRRKRQLAARMALSWNDWRFGAMLLTNRHRVGAHGGVIPPGTVYETLYNRLLAGVADGDAVRERYRSDVAVTASGALAGRAVSAVVLRTQQLLRYVQGGDSLSARVVRYGLDVSAPVVGGPVSAALHLAGTVDGVPTGSAVPDSIRAEGRKMLSMQVRGRADGRGFDVGYAAGASVGAAAGLVGSVSSGLTVAGLRLRAEAASAPAPESAFDRWGFGPEARGPRAAGAGRLDRVSAGFEVARRSITASVRWFAHRETGTVWWRVSAAGLVGTRLEQPVTSTGVVAHVGLRTAAERGVYTHLTGLVPMGGSAAEPSARDQTLPDVSGRVVLGWRARWFQGDAIVDLQLDARGWTTWRGRRLHAATGLLVAADDASRDVPGSVRLDLRADVDVRAATLFLALENVLSGTDLVLGNQMVLDYPLPERRFRFGVFWPIFD